MKTLIILCAPCGVGKSTIKDLLNESKQLPDFVCLDTDEIGVGWHNYSGAEKENQYYTDCLTRTLEISGGNCTIRTMLCQLFDDRKRSLCFYKL
ncbi:MAG: hypothetical protein K5829_07315 [Treponema sp.]|nr:hypothetical protein [Treponema sp.]